MASASSLFGTESVIERIYIASSITFNPPYKMRALVRCIGGGGSGAIALDGASTQVAATGAGAGEHSGSIVTLDPATNYTATVGAGGAVVTDTSPSTVATAGNAGGATSFSGSDITTITANGGSGGAADRGTGILSVSGGAGGTGGAGALFAITGGAGGDHDGVAGTNNRSFATGGGAVGFKSGTGYAGGAIDVGNTNGREVTTGGGGIGGKGGKITITSGSGDKFSYGGSCIGPAPDNVSNADGDPPPGTATDAMTPAEFAGLNATLLFSLFNGTPHFYYTTDTTDSEQHPGVGGKGTTTNELGVKDGGAFAGGGGAARAGNQSDGGTGGYPGGGGGGAAIVNQSTDTVTSGAGGDGIIIIEVLEVLG